LGRETVYEYDEIDRLICVTEPDPNGEEPGSGTPTPSTSKPGAPTPDGPPGNGGSSGGGRGVGEYVDEVADHLPEKLANEVRGLLEFFDPRHKLLEQAIMGALWQPSFHVRVVAITR
jgi:hypothetical protein